MMIVSPRGDRIKNCEIMLSNVRKDSPECMSKPRGLVYASLLLLLRNWLPTKAISLWVINTAGRNDATVAKAMYISLAGIGISYPQMACVMRSRCQATCLLQEPRAQMHPMQP